MGGYMFFERRIGQVVSAGALGISLVLAACGPAAQPADGGSGAQPVEEKIKAGAEVAKERGGKLIAYNTGAFANPNDPHLTATANGRVYGTPIVNWLMKRDVHDQNFPIINDLAKGWTLSPDGLTYTFKLQEGVKFHNVAPVNGREFTSADAKYSLMRVTADPSVIEEKWKPRFQRRLDFGDIQSIDAPDKYTLVVKLKEPYAPFMDAVANPGTAILPKEFVDTFPDKIITEGTIGTGPYLPAEYRHQQLATYKKNPDYWKKDSQGGQLPYLDEVQFLYFADTQAALASFRARQIDTVSGNKVAVDTIKKDMPTTNVFTIKSANLWMFRFNMSYKPFQDVRVRKAIHLAVDRNQVADLITGGTGVVSGPVTPLYSDLAGTTDWLLSQPGYRKDKTQDLAEAKRLMQEAGYADGLAFDLLTSTNLADAPDTLALVQDQLKPLKITFKTEIVDYAGQWVPRSTQSEFQMTFMTHALATDADSLLSPHLLTGAPRNYGKFSDTGLDDSIKKQRAASTLEDRKKWAQEAEKRVLEVVPVVFLIHPTTFEMAQPWVHNGGGGPLAGSTAYVVEQAWVEKH